MYFQRTAEQDLAKWLAAETRKPLVIRGARQVGKTALVREFCRKQGLDLLEINLEEQKVSEFERESFDISRCLGEITALAGKRLNDKSLIFIDEIQESEKAYSRLRFFKEQRPEVPVIAAGSLLEARLKETKQKIPVGRIEYFFLGPFTFGEFLLARNQHLLLERLKELFTGQFAHTLSASVHDLLVRHLMDYLYVGGMPEVVRRFIVNEADYLAAREAQKQILNAYLEDVDRYATGKVAEVIKDVLERIAFEIGQKIIYSRLSSAKATYVKSALDILEGVFLIQKVTYTHASGLPLKKTEDPDVYKTYLLDVGLYNCMMDVGWSDIAGLDYDNLLSKGAMAEQFIAQHFFLGAGKTSRPRVNYWLREKAADNAEVDFIRCYHNRIVPVEVKAGKPGRIKSLLKFMEEKQSLVSQAIRFDLHFREQFMERVNFNSSDGRQADKIAFDLLNLPLYGVEFMADT